jgi:hypothetical protein
VASWPGVTDAPSKNCGRSEPQRALARTRSKSWPVFGSGTDFWANLISLFPTKKGTLQLEGMVLLMRCELMKALRADHKRFRAQPSRRICARRFEKPIQETILALEIDGANLDL